MIGAACVKVFKTPLLPTEYIGTASILRSDHGWSNAGKPYQLTGELSRTIMASEYHYSSIISSSFFYIDTKHTSLGRNMM